MLLLDLKTKQNNDIIITLLPVLCVVVVVSVVSVVFGIRVVTLIVVGIGLT